MNLCKFYKKLIKFRTCLSENFRNVSKFDEIQVSVEKDLTNFTHFDKFVLFIKI